ncbi:MAG: DVUA0089 family protein, partial [Pirellulaceae bacterium]|nr:DVUA0089 family protein [Pirellulaceae bacterium]
FPGDWDVVHLNRILPPRANDIDLYEFQLPADGTFSAEVVAQRSGSRLDAVLTLFDADGNMVARNDAYYSKDPFVQVPLAAGTYFVGVTSIGNDHYDPNIPDSGFGGRTDGAYQLKLEFAEAPVSSLVDTSGTPLDGDLNGVAGGVFQFWFESSARTIFIDKANDTTAGVVDGDGSLANPYDSLPKALQDAARRIVVPDRVNPAGLEGQTFRINDGINPAVTFEFDTNGSVPLGRRAVNVASAANAGDVALAIRNAIDAAVTAGVLSNVTRVLQGNIVQLDGGAGLRLDVAGSAALLSGANIVRVVGNGGLDANLGTLSDNRPYLVGIDQQNQPLPDGNGVAVPQGTTLMVDEGVLFKSRQANIDVGTTAVNIDRRGAALQVLGTLQNPVRFRSYRDDSVGGNQDPTDPDAKAGDWGGLVFRNDSDQEGQGIFVSWVAQSEFQHGGGGVRVGAVTKTFAPIHLETARPSILFNTFQFSADAAISANPNSFDDSLDRIGPLVRGNKLTQNSVNGLFIRIETADGVPLDTLDVHARFDDTDIVHVIAENLVITGNAGGPVNANPDFSGRLRIDPGLVVKLKDARIEARRGVANLIAEGLPGYPIIFTSVADDRYGMGGTFDSNNDGVGAAAISVPRPGDWGGLMFNHVSRGSVDHVLLTYGGGETPIEGGFAHFNAVEIHQADVRIANSTFENNANGRTTPGGTGGGEGEGFGDSGSGTSGGSGTGGAASGAGGWQYDQPPTGAGWTARNGRGDNTATTIYVLGAQPTIVDNVFQNNAGSVLWMNANSLNHVVQPDRGRATGFADAYTQFADNRGPLVRLNRMSDNAVNGLEVGPEVLTTMGIWDDTDIVHVVRGEIALSDNYHTYGGLRLQSSENESLVIKLLGANAGFTVNGKPLDIVDRMGNSLHILGSVGHPVVFTSLYDSTVGAGLTPDGQPQYRTVPGATGPSAGNWRSIRLDRYSNDRNVATINEIEPAFSQGRDLNNTPIKAQLLGTLSPDEKGGDEARRLGFEVHGYISLDNTRDQDIYAFNATPGTEVWLDLDRTGSALDAVLELIDEDGNVLGQSIRNDQLSGIAQSLNPNPLLVGEFFTHNFRDPGMRVILPEIGASVGTYFVRVRSNGAELVAGGANLQFNNNG